jgi:carbon-monoxide dehydrogenase medium subunit
MHLCAWADMPVVLLALGGILHVRHAEKGAFDVGIDEIVETHPRKLLPDGSLITGATVPLGSRGAGAAARRGAAYHRFRATATENPLITVGVLLEVEAGRCSDARVVVGAVIPRPRRAPAAESILVGTALDDETIARAAEKVDEDVACAPNFRMAQEVRARILGVMTRRAIAEAAGRASQGGDS